MARRAITTKGLRVALAAAGLLAVLALGAPNGQTQGPCTISWDGSLGANKEWAALSPNGPGPEDDITNWSPERIPNANDHACLPAGADATITNSAADVGHYTIGAGATVTLNDNGANGIHAQEDSLNAGTINFAGQSRLNHNNGDASDGEGLTNTGTINFLAGGSAGFRMITSDFTNQGTVNVNHPEASIQRQDVGGAVPVGTHVNQGTIAIGSGGALRILNANFTHGTGSVINGAGTMNAGNTRFQVSGNASIAAGTDVNIGDGATLVGTAGAAATGNIDVAGQNTARLEGTVPSGIAVDVDGSLQAAPADTANAGTIRLNGPGSKLQILPNDGVNSTSKLTNTGTIQYTAGGADGLRFVHGDLVNQGTLAVNHPEASYQRFGAGGNPPSKLTNTGTITTTPSNALRIIDQSTVVHGPSSVFNGGGTVNMSGGRLEVSGNSQVASGTDFNMSGGARFVGSASAASGNFDFLAGSATFLQGTVPANVVLDIDSGHVETPSAAGTNTVNAGRININNASAALSIMPDDPATPTTKLTNTGTIAYTDTGAGLRMIHGDLDNQGTLLVDHPDASFQRVPAGGFPPSRLTNSGTITVNAGDNLRVCCGIRGVVNASGATMNGTGSIGISGGAPFEVQGNSQIGSGLDVNLAEDADLTFTNATGATGNVDVSSNSEATLGGNVPAGFSIDVGDSQARLRALSSFTNAGTINLRGVNAVLAAEDGNEATTETLTNTGTITTQGTGGVAALSGDLVNQGQIQIGHDQSRFDREYESRSPKLTNAAGGTLAVAAGADLASFPGQSQGVENAGAVTLNARLAPLTYTQTAGTTTLNSGSSIALTAPGAVALQGGTLRGVGTITGGDVNNTGGTVAPGTSPGTLTFAANYTQGASGTLAAEVQGAAPGTGHDQLVVGGTASLGGTLAIATSAFTPTANQQFKVLDAPAPPSPAVSGSFSTVQAGGSPNYAVAVNANDVTIRALAPPSPPPGGGGTPANPSPPSAPGGGGGQVSAPDTTRPVLTLSGRKRQRLGRSVSVTVRCNERCTATATGTLTASKRYTLKRARRTIAAGRRVQMKLALSAKAVKAARRSLGRRKKVRARLTVTVVDTAGNRTTKKMTVTLQRR